MTNNVDRSIDDIANDVRSYLNGAVENIIRAGTALQKARDMLPSDNAFHQWCLREIPELQPRTRLRLMHVGSKFGTTNLSNHIPISVLYELAAPSVPKDFVEGFLSSTEPVKVKDVQEAKKITEIFKITLFLKT